MQKEPLYFFSQNAKLFYFTQNALFSTYIKAELTIKELKW